MNNNMRRRRWLRSRLWYCFLSFPFLLFVIIIYTYPGFFSLPLIERQDYNKTIEAVAVFPVPLFSFSFFFSFSFLLFYVRTIVCVCGIHLFSHTMVIFLLYFISYPCFLLSAPVMAILVRTRLFESFLPHPHLALLGLTCSYGASPSLVSCLCRVRSLWPSLAECVSTWSILVLGNCDAPNGIGYAGARICSLQCKSPSGGNTVNLNQISRRRRWTHRRTLPNM